MQSALTNRISSSPDICNGKPVIRGMRITVSTILEYLAAGESIRNILKAYPVLEKADILACLAFAKKVTDKSVLEHDVHTP